MTDEGRGKGMETCFPWAARRPIFKWFVRAQHKFTSFLSLFFQINGPTASWVVSSSSSYSQQHLFIQSKFISCYDITVELQRLEELYAGRETEEKLRSK